MRSRITAILSILGISVVGLAAASIAGFGSSSSNRASGLAARLPESDVVAIFDARRFFDDALPKLFAANQPMLADVTGKLDQMQQRTGIDLRKFDQVAVGARMSRVSATEFDLDTVVLASGSYSEEAIVAAVKLASNGSYREESIGGRTVYVFAAKDIAAKNAPKGSPSAIASAVERAVNGMAKEIAVATLDQTTIAFGSLERVRQAIEAKTSVTADVAGLLSSQAVVSFAARTPNGTSKLLPLDNDELGRNLDAIRYLAGSMDVAAGNVSAHLMARTSGPAEAKGLHSTLLGMQELGKNILGGSKRAEQQVLARMIGSAKIGRTANDITLDLSVPQSDIDALIAGAR